MPRLFIEGQRYEALASSALLEHEYQALILQHANALFPGLIVVPFNKTVYYEAEAKKADLAIIEPRYRQWWIGEVERAHHSLGGHVLPQVAVLARAKYGNDDADWLADRNPDLDRGALRQMMLGSQPGVVVIVNAPCPRWVDPLRPDADLMVVELFRSERDRYILRQNGVELAVLGDELSLCAVEPVMPRMLIVESPAELLRRDEDPLQIEFEGSSAEWHLIRVADRVWLTPRRGHPFPAARRLRLMVRPGGRLVFESIDP
jgi:hypothetical protein